jgi:hypothetical protein
MAHRWDILPIRAEAGRQGTKFPHHQSWLHGRGLDVCFYPTARICDEQYHFAAKRTESGGLGDYCIRGTLSRGKTRLDMANPKLQRQEKATRASQARSATKIPIGHRLMAVRPKVLTCAIGWVSRSR